MKRTCVAITGLGSNPDMFARRALQKFANFAAQQRRDVTTIVMGPPGGGKGTISKRMIKDYGYLHISTGDILRQHVRDKTPLGEKAAAFMNSGALVPDQLVIQMVLDELSKHKAEHVLFDGFPRTKAQADELDKHIKIDIALNLEVPTEEIVSRISGRWTHPASGRVYAYDFNPPKVPGKDDVTGEPLIQRDDDKPEAVRKRLATYAEQTAPLIKHYDDKGVLKSFTGDNKPDLVAAGRRSDAIYEAVKQVLDPLHKK